MTTSLTSPLQPRNGHTLKVLAVCRISTALQDERSLKDQEALYRRWLDEHTDVPYELTVIASQGSGECLDRKEHQEAIDLVESCRFDLVITEDLGRICRRVHAHIFCELCEDCETRLIALNDHVDTTREDWRLNSYFAVMRHETYNKDTGQRIRRTQRNRFRNGGGFRLPIYGYIKPEGAKSDQDVRKDPDAEPVYDHWFTMLENGSYFSAVADWLNEQGVPTGLYARNAKWDCRMVGRVTRNRILKGLRVHNERMSKRVNRTGRRRSVKAPPEDRMEREVLHLAFIEPGRYDRVIQMLGERNGKCSRNGENGLDTRRNVPKKRTRFPGQIVECGLCGRRYVFGGHGQTDHLMCNGAREYKCWNGITVDGPLATDKISAAVLAEIEALPDFDAAFLGKVEERAKCADEHRSKHLRDLSAKLNRIERELANVTKFILSGTDSPTIRQELQRLEGEQKHLEYEQNELKRRAADSIVIPSVEELRQLARNAFQDLATDSFEFAELMRTIIPKIIVWPYRLCDGGRPVLRARFRLRLASLLQDSRAQVIVEERLERTIVVDLFDAPQREMYRHEVVSLRESENPETGRRYTEAEVARKLGITKTAAQYGAALQRQMDAMGIQDPYQPVSEPPDDYSKLRRHKHARYSFEPLPGAGQL